MLIFAALVAPAASQAQEDRLFGEEIVVRVINLEVQVTDGRGRHVAGLRPGDFLLELDGKPAKIDYFSEVRDRIALPPGAQGDGGVTPPGAPPPAVIAGERVVNSILVFVDNLFGLARDRRPVLEALAETVTRLEPGDRMLLVSFDGRRLAKIGDWESSADALRANILRAVDLPTGGLRQLGEQSSFDRRLGRQGRAPIEDLGAPGAESFIRQRSGKIERVLQAATSALRGFADVPGRKIMLLTSGGWPRDPSTAAVGFNPEMRGRTRHSFPDEAFDELVLTANQLGYTLYPIDVPGKQVGVRGADAADDGGHIPGIAGGFGSNGRSGRPPVPADLFNAADVLSGGLGFDLETDRELESEATLIELARETGGRALINSERRLALETALTDTASYYWLGFTWTGHGDDRETRIRVRVPGTGHEVRSRRSFRERSARSEATMRVESQLLFDAETDHGGLEVELGTPKLRRRVRQPATLRIPLDRIVMVPTARGFSAQLELRVAAIDETGARSDLPVIPVRVAGPEAPRPGQVAVVDVVLGLRNQKQKLVLALHDPVSGALLTRTVFFEPPDQR